MFYVHRFFSCRAVMGAALSVAALATGCGEPFREGESETRVGREFGNIDVALEVGDEIELREVHYEISGNGFHKSGSANVRRSNVLSLRVGGIPRGNDYEITLQAVDANDEAILCQGGASFDIRAAETSETTVHLACRLPRKKGTVLVDGVFNVCPLIDEVSVLPASVEVGASVELFALATDSDSEPGPLAYSWSSNGGVIGDPSAASTTLECTAPGVVTVTVSAGDGDCEDALTTTVTCTEPGEQAPGEAILLWNEVESSGGTPDDWAELYNAGDAAQDLSGYVFKDNDDTHVYTIPAGTSIEPGEYLVLENYGFGLGSPDSVRLFDPTLNLVLSYSWEPHAPTTYGRCPDVTGEFGVTTTPTKGAANDCSPTILINEVESSGGDPGDWVELFNGGLNTTDLSGWELRDNDDTHSYVIPDGTTIAPGAYLVLEEAAFDFGLGGADSARLFDGAGTLVDTHEWAAHAETTYGRCPNGGGDFTTTAAASKGTANACDVNVKLNEVESSGGTPGDWVEIVNLGLATVNVSGWQFKDNDDTHVYVLPAGSTIAPGAYLVLDEATFGFGLGGGDSARLFDASGILVDSYAWLSHAPETYGRCADGSGEFVGTPSTKGSANSCPLDPNVPEQWPGSSDVLEVDPAGSYPADLSGLHYQPGSPSVLWAVINGEGRVHKLVESAGQWLPEAGDWASGKLVVYPDGTGRPDSEGLTKADWSLPGLYVATERNNENNGVSRLSVLRVDETALGGPLVATNEWNLNSQLPAVGPNLGLEAITWLPDAHLVAAGFGDNNLSKTYDPVDYPNHGTGLFVVGVEGTGDLHVLALDHTTNTGAVVATVDSGHVGVMSLEYDRDTEYLWAGCDNTCGNQTTVLEIVGGALTVTGRFLPPAGLPQSNNEGLAIGAETECASDSKRVFWSDDSNAFSHALRQGEISCGDFF